MKRKVKKMNMRTDLASELIKANKKVVNEVVTVTDFVVNEKSAEKIGKNAGRYITYDSFVVNEFREHEFIRLEEQLCNGIKEFVDGDSVLVVGLGNAMLSADALGVKTCEKINVTRGFCDEIRQTSAISPGVMGNTGIESFEVVYGVVNHVKPDCVIVVDSLCAGASSRLLSSFQISDSGITPGSGVGNNRARIDKSTLGCKVVSIGVPTVVYASTLVRENAGELIGDDMVVTVKDIDVKVEFCARIISKAINRALGV